jgi:hypothetical protein
MQARRRAHIAICEYNRSEDIAGGQYLARACNLW